MTVKSERWKENHKKISYFSGIFLSFDIYGFADARVNEIFAKLLMQCLHFFFFDFFQSNKKLKSSLIMKALNLALCTAKENKRKKETIN
jgi:hypothetical protein